MDSALLAKSLDVVQCGVFVVIKNYPIDGQATIKDLTS